MKLQYYELGALVCKKCNRRCELTYQGWCILCDQEYYDMREEDANNKY